MIHLNRLIGTPGDMISDIYQEQVDELCHGIVTDQFPSLINGNYIFTVGEHFVPKEEQSSSIRDALVSSKPKLLLFEGDVCQALSVKDNLVNLSLMKKGPLRLKKEMKENIFDSGMVVFSYKEKILDIIENIPLSTFIQFNYSRLYTNLGILTQAEASYFLETKQASKEFRDKVETYIKMNNSGLSIFNGVPDLYFASSFERLVNFLEKGPSIDLQSLWDKYEKLHEGIKS